ncbi:unannotated protein [freshwater metagenome]|uniref:Unannotated protein n=1 Tax=freshwater metagenome TaxID=449393 RepID=A0A6J5Z7R1_9ZZZZ
MITASSEHTWKQISDELKSAVGPSLFDVWLAPLKLTRLDGNQLTLEAPAASRAWVTDRFGQILKSSAQSIIGADAEVHVSAAGQDPRQSVASTESHFAAEAGSELNPKYCFEQFVIGNGNRFAHGAALAVAENPGTAYNPLFICGPPGVGKTHLLHSIADYARRHGNGVRVHLTGAEAFANEFISSLRGGDINAFKARHRNADLVLVDDVQFLMAKAKTEEEFFHTFNSLRESGAQIVLTCDRPPRDLNKLEERLRDRFDSGLVADISAPDLATRVAVLNARAQLDQIEIEDDAVVELIATRVERNLRALEGALIRVVAYASLSGRNINTALAEEVLDGLFPQKPHEPKSVKLSVEEIRAVVGEHYEVSVTELCSSSRVASVLWPRQVAMYLARDHSGASLATIAASFGGRNHTTALSACKRVEQRISEDAEQANQLRQLGDQLFKTSANTRGDRS